MNQSEYLLLAVSRLDYQEVPINYFHLKPTWVQPLPTSSNLRGFNYTTSTSSQSLTAPVLSNLIHPSASRCRCYHTCYNRLALSSTGCASLSFLAHHTTSISSLASRYKRFHPTISASSSFHAHHVTWMDSPTSGRTAISRSVVLTISYYHPYLRPFSCKGSETTFDHTSRLPKYSSATNFSTALVSKLHQRAGVGFGFTSLPRHHNAAQYSTARNTYQMVRNAGTTIINANNSF
ncbi:hypothetical protein B0H13DRAFT_2030948 [Mycena leptocephala]|nr:hypothetical protein B0H13DRAFT_2030948 [Mycena leptocephala]